MRTWVHSKVVLSRGLDFHMSPPNYNVYGECTWHGLISFLSLADGAPWTKSSWPVIQPRPSCINSEGTFDFQETLSMTTPGYSRCQMGKVVIPMWGAEAYSGDEIIHDFTCFILFLLSGWRDADLLLFLRGFCLQLWSWEGPDGSFPALTLPTTEDFSFQGWPWIPARFVLPALNLPCPATPASWNNVLVVLCPRPHLCAVVFIFSSLFSHSYPI